MLFERVGQQVHTRCCQNRCLSFYFSSFFLLISLLYNNNNFVYTFQRCSEITWEKEKIHKAKILLFLSVFFWFISFISVNHFFAQPTFLFVYFLFLSPFIDLLVQVVPIVFRYRLAQATRPISRRNKATLRPVSATWVAIIRMFQVIMKALPSLLCGRVCPLGEPRQHAKATTCYRKPTTCII